jgi:hypothetical protein
LKTKPDIIEVSARAPNKNAGHCLKEKPQFLLMRDLGLVWVSIPIPISIWILGTYRSCGNRCAIA